MESSGSQGADHLAEHHLAEGWLFLPDEQFDLIARQLDLVCGDVED